MLIGSFSVFPAVRYFCLYTSAGLVFTYLYQISFFGACMAYSGKRELQNRHCFLFTRLPTSADAKKKSFWYKVFCTGGDGKLSDFDCVSSVYGTVTTGAPVTCEISPKDNIFNVFFQRYYAPLLNVKMVQFLAGISYIVYLAMAIYGTTTIQVGMNYAELLPDHTTTKLYFEDYERYFIHYSPPLEVLLPKGLDWEDENVQRTSLKLSQSLEDTPYTGPAEFWLFDFLPFAASRRISLSSSGYQDLDFLTVVSEFLSKPDYNKYGQHIRFQSTNQISSSRFLVSIRGIPFGQEWEFLKTVKDRISASGLPGATAYHASFQLGEQQAAVLPATLKTTAAATLVMLVISFLLIPKPACSVCLAACIISTNLGVLGAMSLWGVRLDIVSMITILMSIGISVDFVAHISYFYVQALELDIPVSKAQRALRYLGLPILQGAFSTICGMLVLLAIPAYMIRAFVKTMLLVILFGIYHGLLLLPLTLSLFIRDTPKKPVDLGSSSSGGVQKPNAKHPKSRRIAARAKRKREITVATTSESSGSNNKTVPNQGTLTTCVSGKDSGPGGPCLSAAKLATLRRNLDSLSHIPNPHWFDIPPPHKTWGVRLPQPQRAASGELDYQIHSTKVQRQAQCYAPLRTIERADCDRVVRWLLTSPSPVDHSDEYATPNVSPNLSSDRF